MTQPDLETAARTFFDEFVVAFGTFDGAALAARYLAPYLAFHARGRAEVFQSKAEIATYFQHVLDAYRDGGCRACRYRDLAVVPIGAESLLASVTWELLAEGGAVLERWRESYNLHRSEGGLRVFASTDHVDPAKESSPFK